jgi:hypothetical protein
MAHVFLLSPANTNGLRAQYLLFPRSPFAVAIALRARTGAPLADVFSFMSGLYFRGKVAYARAFAQPLANLEPAYVITSSHGLMPLDARITLARLRAFQKVPIDLDCSAYRKPFVRDLRTLRRRLPSDAKVVLLGSIASDKYVLPLGEAFGERLVFPTEFVGRGDMSRGGLLLRSAADGVELAYAPVLSAVRKGSRPPRLKPRPGLQALLRGRHRGRVV